MAATDAVWVDVLPSMRGFGPALAKGTEQEADKAGKATGRRFGTALLAGVAVVAAGAGLAVKSLATIGETFANLETQIATSTGASGRDLDRLSESAKRVSRDVPASFEEIGKAVSSVASSFGFADLTDEEFDRATANALNFSKAFEQDLDRVTQVSSQLLKTGLVKDADEAFDLLTAASQKVPAALRGDLLDAADEYGPFFAQIGISGEEAMSALVAASEKGMYGIDKTGDALKEFTIRATDMSAASKVGFDALGLSQEDMTAKLLAGGETGAAAFQQIVSGLKDIKDPVEQSQAALALFGTPLEDLGTENIPTFIASLADAKSTLGDVEGSADSLGKNLNGGLKNELQLLRNELTVMVAPAAEKVFGALSSGAALLREKGLPALKAFGGFIVSDVVPALRNFGGWIKDNETVIKVIAGVIAAVLIPHYVALGVAAVASGAKQAAGWVASQVGAARAVVLHSASVVKMVAGWVALGASSAANAARVVGAWVLMGAQSLIQAARMAAAWFIALGPIGWAIAAVIAIVAIVIANWDTIVRVTKDLWKKATGFFSDLWAKGKAMFLAGVKVVKDIVVGFVADQLLRYMALRDKVLGFFTNLRDGARDRVRKMREWAIEQIVSLVTGSVTKATELRDKVLGFFGGLRDGARDRVKTAREWVMEQIGSLKSSAETRVRDTRDQVLGFFAGLRDGGRDRIKTMREWILGQVDTLKTSAETKAGDIKDKVLGAFETLRDKGKTAFENLRDGIGTFMDGIREKARVPVNFVLDTVYNRGIKAGFDKIAETFGSKTRLPKADIIPPIVARRKGGWTRKGMVLVGEEGPELVDFKTPGRVYTAAQTRQMKGSDEVEDAPHIGGFDDIISGVRSAISSVTTALSDPAAFIRKQTERLLEAFPAAGTFGSIVARMPGKILDLAKDKVMELVGGLFGGDGSSAPYTGPSVGGWVRPLRGGIVTSEYGPRGGRRHSGIDISTGGGATVMAARAGRVKARKYHPSWGNHVQIQHDTGMTNYAHMVAPGIVAPGQIVKAGQPLGREGNTGNSFGAHLHFEWSPNGRGRINPRVLPIKFDTGGYVPPGVHQVANLTRRPEMMLPPRIGDWLEEAAMNSRKGGGYPEVLEVRDVDGVLMGAMEVTGARQVRAQAHADRMYQ